MTAKDRFRDLGFEYNYVKYINDNGKEEEYIVYKKMEKSIIFRIHDRNIEIKCNNPSMNSVYLDLELLEAINMQTKEME